VKGIVDYDLRALLEIRIGAVTQGTKSTVMAWVDTAFNGGLMLPRNEIERLGLKEYSSTPATLADGQQVELPTFTCYLEWFGNEYRTQIVGNSGAHPLLGTMLLDQRELAISYKRKTVALD